MLLRRLKHSTVQSGTEMYQRMTDVRSDEEEPRPSLALSLAQAGLARVGVVGVASFALLSGFGAVNLPYQQVATLFRNVPPR